MAEREQKAEKAVPGHIGMGLPTPMRFSTDSILMATDNSVAKSSAPWLRKDTDTILLEVAGVTIDLDCLAPKKGEENFDPTIGATAEVLLRSEGLKVRNHCGILVIDQAGAHRKADEDVAALTRDLHVEGVPKDVVISGADHLVRENSLIDSTPTVTTN